MNPIALYKVSYGLYIVSSIKDGKMNAQIANTVTQVTAEPAQITVALNTQNLTHEFVQSSGVFAVSILSQICPMKHIGQFGFHSGRDIDKFEGVDYVIGKSGAPIVRDYSIAFLEAKVTRELNVGTHTIFLGEVIDAEILNDHEPLTYAYYHQIKGGKSPKNAPTFLSEEKIDSGAVSHKCKICGYTYDRSKGDPDGNISPGTEFSEISADWTCPICQAAKDKFELIEQTSDRYKCSVCGYVYDPKVGDPDGGIEPGTPFSELPEDWKCPVCMADKSKFQKEK